MESAHDIRGLMQEGRRTNRALTQHLIDEFADGEFHLLCDIAASIEKDLPFTRKLCQRILARGLFHTVGDRRRAPPSQGGFAYRFVKGGKRINLEAFYAEVQPTLDDMDRLINGPRVDFSQQAMKVVFAQLLKVIDRVVR